MFAFLGGFSVKKPLVPFFIFWKLGISLAQLISFEGLDQGLGNASCSGGFVCLVGAGGRGWQHSHPGAFVDAWRCSFYS